MKRFKIAVIQTGAQKGKVTGNVLRALAQVERAAQKGAKIVCLPELFDTGYYLDWVKKNAQPWPNFTTRLLGVAAKNLGIYLIAGLARKRGRKLYNSAAVFAPSGKMLGFYDKNYLFRAAPANEARYFCEGKRSRLFNTRYGKVGIAICNDLKYPELFLKLAREGAKIIFVSSAWSTTRLKQWQTFLRARAAENQLYVAAANCTGKGDMKHCGHSAIIDFTGETLSEKKSGEGILVALVDYRAMEASRREVPTFQVRKRKRGKR